MKLIIAGGRDYRLTVADYNFLYDLKPHVTEVVTGACPTGADECGEQWADLNGIRVRRYPARWDEYGKMAGPMRNAEMAAYADAVALFPGGKGTASMYREAKKAHLLIYDRRRGETKVEKPSIPMIFRDDFARGRNP